MKNIFLYVLRKIFLIKHHYPVATFVGVLFIVAASTFFAVYVFSNSYIQSKIGSMTFDRVVHEKQKEAAVLDGPKYPPLDKELYDQKLLILAQRATTTLATSTSATSTKPVKVYRWPVKTAYPRDGAILPFKRIIAYYGNFLSKGMGVLGEYPEEIMLAKFDAEIAKWNKADPSTPVMPAIHYIAVTAQGSPGREGMYRLRMPDAEIEKALAIAQKRNGIVFLDIQVGLSSLQKEVPLLKKYLMMPQVHLGIDPEFSMKTGAKPGTVVGTFDAADINYAVNYLAQIVKDNDLPPKILIIHRYTEKMVTNYRMITPTPEVQIIMHMDGWGGKEHKKSTYQVYVAQQPVQFTGFKLFYKNDVKEQGTILLSPEELLKLTPQPSYIQYQ